MTDERYRWARQPTLRNHLAECRKLEEWNRLAAAAGRRPAPPPAPPILTSAGADYRQAAREAARRAAREEMDAENDWRRDNGLEEWAWPEWCGWHRIE
jgi:hypothetical protein